jgi:hypothetical protein
VLSLLSLNMKIKQEREREGREVGEDRKREEGRRKEKGRDIRAGVVLHELVRSISIQLITNNISLF